MEPPFNLMNIVLDTVSTVIWLLLSQTVSFIAEKPRSHSAVLPGNVSAAARRLTNWDLSFPFLYFRKLSTIDLAGKPNRFANLFTDSSPNKTNSSLPILVTSLSCTASVDLPAVLTWYRSFYQIHQEWQSWSVQHWYSVFHQWVVLPWTCLLCR